MKSWSLTIQIKPLSSTFLSVTYLICCAKWYISLSFESVDEILKWCDCRIQLCSDNNLGFVYIGCLMEIIVINKLMVCLTILAPLFTECRVIVLWVRLCFCTYTPQSWKPFNIPVFVCAEKNRVNCFSQATDKWHRWRCSAQDLCLKKMLTNLNPVNESEELISNWRIQKSKDDGSDIIAQPRSTSFLSVSMDFHRIEWIGLSSEKLLSKCNYSSWHNRPFLKTDKTKGAQRKC